MTRDRGYPDWLVLSALLRLLWAGYISTKYICFGCVWLVAMCRYYSLLLCVVIFVTGGGGREALGWGPPADWGPKAIA